MKFYHSALVYAFSFLLISACSGGSSETEEPEKEEPKVLTPEDVVKDFVNALADGNCAAAKKMATGNAIDIVQGSIDAGCMSYSTTVKSVECVETGDMAECQCVEKRDGIEYVYDYTLEKAGEDWKVSNYGKNYGPGDDTSMTVVDTSATTPE